MKNNIKLILCLIIPLAVGAIGSIASTSSIGTWYITINKPFFNPPNYLFGPVWTILYILMGISFYRIIQSPLNEIRKKAIILFCTQLFLNFCWSFIFFKFRRVDIDDEARPISAQGVLDRPIRRYGGWRLFCARAARWKSGQSFEEENGYY